MKDDAYDFVQANPALEGLSRRAVNALRWLVADGLLEHPVTHRQVAERITARELLVLPNVGRGTMDDVGVWLNSAGLSLIGWGDMQVCQHCGALSGPQQRRSRKVRLTKEQA